MFYRAHEKTALGIHAHADAREKCPLFPFQPDESIIAQLLAVAQRSCAQRQYTVFAFQERAHRLKPYDILSVSVLSVKLFGAPHPSPIERTFGLVAAEPDVYTEIAE